MSMTTFLISWVILLHFMGAIVFSSLISSNKEVQHLLDDRALKYQAILCLFWPYIAGYWIFAGKVKEEEDRGETCNHHHPIKKNQQTVDYGTGEFVADVERIPLLKALNECGLITRTHCYGHETEVSFVAILMRNDLFLEIKNVSEPHSGRKFEGEKELLLVWKRTD